MEFPPIKLPDGWDELLPEQCKDCRPLRLLALKLSKMCLAGEIEEVQAVETLNSLRDGRCLGPVPEVNTGSTCSKPNCRHGQGEMYLVAKTAKVATQGLSSLEI